MIELEVSFDGVTPFKNSTYTYWPVTASIRNLPKVLYASKLLKSNKQYHESKIYQRKNSKFVRSKIQKSLK